MSDVQGKVRHFRLRLTVLMLIALIPACVAVLVLSYKTLLHEVAHAQESARQTAEFVARELATKAETKERASDEYAAIEAMLAHNRAARYESIWLMRPDGQVVWRHFGRDDSALLWELEHRPIDRLLRMTPGEMIDFWVDGDGTRRVFAQQVAPEGLIVAVLLDEARVAADHWRIVAVGFVVVGFVALAGLAVIWFGVGQLYARRLTAVTSAAQRFVGGDLSARVEPVRHGSFFDELDFIGEAFNSLADLLAERERSRQTTLTQLRASNDLNDSILDSLALFR